MGPPGNARGGFPSCQPTADAAVPFQTVRSLAPQSDTRYSHGCGSSPNERMHARSRACSCAARPPTWQGSIPPRTRAPGSITYRSLTLSGGAGAFLANRHYLALSTAADGLAGRVESLLEADVMPPRSRRELSEVRYLLRALTPTKGSG